MARKQACRKTQAAQASLKMWGWKDNKIYSFLRKKQKRQTIALEKDIH